MAKMKDTNKVVQNGRECRREKSEPLLAVPEDERWVQLSASLKPTKYSSVKSTPACK